MVRSELRHARIVEQRVDFAERLGCRGDPSAPGVLGHVGLDERGDSASRLHQPGGFLGRVRIAGIVYDDRTRIKLLDLLGDGAAQFRRPTCYHNDGVREIGAQHVSPKLGAGYRDRRRAVLVLQ